tara:strand:- start:30 stop:1211 length:1182 start_codon:yes stop_codon:yes gene_type:complete
MKIAFIEDSSFMGGVQYSTLYLSQQFIEKRKNIEVLILIPGQGPFTEICEKSFIPYKTYKNINYLSSSFSFFNDKIRIPNIFAWIYNILIMIINSIIIGNSLNKIDIDIVITKGLLNHICAGFASKRIKIPIIWHLQDLIGKHYFGLLRMILNYFAKKIPQKIICDGSLIKDSLSPLLWKKTKVILNGIDSKKLNLDLNARNYIRKEFSIPADAYLIGHLARITPWKGQRVLLDAFIEYSKTNDNAYLLLIGSPLFSDSVYLKTLKKMIKNHKLENRVILPGFRTDLKELFSAMDIFVYPSIKKDTSPLALLSAICFGLPTIVSNIRSLKEVVDSCPSIDVFNIRNKNKLILLLKKHENLDIRQVNGNKNKIFGQKNFDIVAHANKIYKFLSL